MARELTENDEMVLRSHAERPLDQRTASKLCSESRRHWDLFYKRNGNRFFKNRHWTEREFSELADPPRLADGPPRLLELGCGVGDLVVPLLEADTTYRIWACDLSQRAIDILKSHPLYDGERVEAFVADFSSDDLVERLPPESCDVVTLVFALSAVGPSAFTACLRNAFALTRPGGILLFRDYARYDAAQLRFKPGRMIEDNFYARQDGTTTYFFRLEETADLFTSVGYEMQRIEYVQRRTVNRKEDVDVPRYFLQAKFKKPLLT